MCVLDAYFGYGYNHVSILVSVYFACVLHVLCMWQQCASFVVGVHACVPACVKVKDTGIKYLPLA